MARWWIQGRVGEFGELVVRWKDSRIVQTRFPVDDMALFADEVAMFRKDKHVLSVERHVDGVVVERYEGVY